MNFLFTFIETKDKNSRKWKSLKESDFSESSICQRNANTKNYKNIKISPFECSETALIDFLNEENFASKINEYQQEEVLLENNYLHFFHFWNDVKRIKYISFDDIVAFDYKKNINKEIYNQNASWQYEKCLQCIIETRRNKLDEKLTYEKFLGERFFEDLENLIILLNTKDIRICFFIDDILKT